MKPLIYQNQPLTIAAIQKDNEVRIGVARFGGHETEKFIPELGKRIALHRAEIQPYSIVEGKLTPKQFELVTTLITSHIQRSRQWEPRLQRIKN